LKREQRAARFGPIESKAVEPPSEVPVEEDVEKMEVDFREERYDPPPTVQRRIDTLHLYGTDEMNTDNIFEFFRVYDAKFVEWINDSSCNVVFESAEVAQKALDGSSTQLENTTAVTDTEGADSSDTNLYQWRKGLNSKSSNLMMRISTVEDVRKEKKPSAFYKKYFQELDEAKEEKKKQETDQNNKRSRGEELQVTFITSNENERRRHRKRNRKGKQRGDVEMKDAEPAELDPEEAERRKKRMLRFFPEQAEAEQNTTQSEETTKENNEER